jgi:thiamine monophosphate synthase
VDPAAAAALCASAGAAVLARAKNIPAAQRDPFLRECVRVADYSGTLCLIAGPTDLARSFGAGGAHLSSTHSSLKPRPDGLLVGRSTHSLVELEGAHREQCDYAFLSPIYASTSKVGLEGRGLAFLRAATRVAKLPVIALGGVLPARIEDATMAGAYGVAALGPFASRDAGKHARMFLRALGRAEGLGEEPEG